MDIFPCGLFLSFLLRWFQNARLSFYMLRRWYQFFCKFSMLQPLIRSLHFLLTLSFAVLYLLVLHENTATLLPWLQSTSLPNLQFSGESSDVTTKAERAEYRDIISKKKKTITTVFHVFICDYRSQFSHTYFRINFTLNTGNLIYGTKRRVKRREANVSFATTIYTIISEGVNALLRGYCIND